MNILRCVIGILGISLAFFTTGWSQTIALITSAVMITSILHSLLLRHRLQQLVDPDWAFQGQTTTGSDQLDLLSRAIRDGQKKLAGRIDRLAAERDRLGVLLEGMAEGVISLDAQGRINACNDAGQSLLDSQGDSLGLRLIEVLRVPALHEVVRQALQGHGGEAEFERPDGRNHLARVRPLQQGGAVLVVLDLTEVRRLERVRKDFVANVEHELRTPVAVIQSSSEVLVTHGALEGRSLDLAKAIHRHAERLGSLIASLLELSRLEAGQFSAALGPIDVHQEIERSLLLCQAHSEASGAKIRHEQAGDLRILADRQALEQVLVNLIDNALKYGGESILVAARPAGDHVEILIEDDGQGIEARHQDRLFERFYRVDGGRSRDRGGSGLGLAIVKHLCQAMNGSVRFEDRAPQGSRFVVSLAVAPESVPDGAGLAQSS